MSEESNNIEEFHFEKIDEDLNIEMDVTRNIVSNALRCRDQAQIQRYANVLDVTMEPGTMAEWIIVFDAARQEAQWFELVGGYR